MDEFLKSDSFKIVYALSVFIILIVLTVRMYREEIDVESYKLATCGVVATIFMYFCYLMMG